MKKILRFLAAIVLALSLSTGMVSAGHDISNTGPGSHNEIDEENVTEIDESCEVDGNIDNENEQNAGSGDSEVKDNTNGGSGSSGNVGNDNDTDTEIDVDCGDGDDGDNEPEQPGGGNNGGGNGGGNNGGNNGQGGNGGGVVGGASTTTGASGVAALPDTGENDALVSATAAIGGIGALAVLAQAGTMLYRRHALNS